MTTIEELRQGRLGSTRRVDAWWVEPLATALGLVTCFGYLTMRAFNATHVWFAPYISPTVAPAIFTPSSGYPGAVPVDHAWLGAFPAWWPALLPQSPAFFVPVLAIGFRATCYYYRGAYYKAVFLTPPSCTVGGAPRRYHGEKGLFLFQNLHRYTFYCALFILVCLWWEAASAFFLDGRFGVGAGTVVMLINAALLTSYTFGCHSCRHLVGGLSDCFSCNSARYGMWKGSTWLNEHHMLFAWCSLVWVAFTDFYIYLLSTGLVREWRTW